MFCRAHGLAFAATLLFIPGLGRAEPPRAVVVRAGPDSCPTAAAVAARLGELLRTVRVSAGEGEAGALEVRLEDHGDRYTVALDGDAREVADAGRDCEERTRVAAVFVALALDPPAVLAEASDTELPTDRVRATPAPPPFGVRLVLAGRVDGAPSREASLAGGGTARVLLGGVRYGATFGAGAAGPTTLSLGAGRAGVVRVPVDAGGYAALRWRRLEARAEGGISLSVLRIAGEGMELPARWTGVEIGLRAAATLGLALGRRLTPFLGIDAVLVPSPHDLWLLPVGVVGHTPRVWLGGLAGLTARLQ